MAWTVGRFFSCALWNSLGLRWYFSIYLSSGPDKETLSNASNVKVIKVWHVYMHEHKNHLSLNRIQMKRFLCNLRFHSVKYTIQLNQNLISLLTWQPHILPWTFPKVTDFSQYDFVTENWHNRKLLPFNGAQQI